MGAARDHLSPGPARPDPRPRAPSPPPRRVRSPTAQRSTTPPTHTHTPPGVPRPAAPCLQPPVLDCPGSAAPDRPASPAPTRPGPPASPPPPPSRPGPAAPRYSPAAPVAAAGGAGARLGVAVLLQGCGREGVQEAGGQRRPAEAAARPGQEESQLHLARPPSGTRSPGGRTGGSAPAAGPNPRPPPGAERGSRRASGARPGVGSFWGGRPRLTRAAFSNSARWALRRQRGRGVFSLTLGGPRPRRSQWLQSRGSGSRVPGKPDLAPASARTHSRTFPTKSCSGPQTLVGHPLRARRCPLGKVV